jgi:hypothetical protein
LSGLPQYHVHLNSQTSVSSDFRARPIFRGRQFHFLGLKRECRAFAGAMPRVP